MANSFGSLWVGTSGLQSASNGLNTTSNNLSNVNTEGYVREQVVYEDRDYRKIGTAAISTQYSGLGVQVGTIVHARDVFLDKAYRTENGRYSFYQASADAVDEVETYLQESDGEAFQGAIADFYEAFAEFAKDPSDTVNQNLVLQKASLFLSRATAVQDGFEDYQSIINSKITDDVNRINEIGKEISEINERVQAIEAGNIEQAMDLRDTRDSLLDELSGLCRISYLEDANGIEHVEIEGVQFIDEVGYNEVGLNTDLTTGYVTPYWEFLSEPDLDKYVNVFNLDNVAADKNSDIGEIKSYLMARGDHEANYIDFLGVSSEDYESGIGNSIMMNSESELDTLIHQIVTTINDLFSPLTTIGDVYGSTVSATYVDADGKTVELLPGTKILDVENCDVGSDEELPPRELFTRNGTDRYTEVYATLSDGTKQKMWVYNEEDTADSSKCYTLKSLNINEDLVEQESLIPFKTNTDPKSIDYVLGDALESMWNNEDFNLNPSDTTPTSFRGFYTKWIGEIGTTGSVYKTTATSLQGTEEQIEASRQGVIGVSSDEELTNMIKYQSAYNASSRYINVINEMIEHLISSLGS